MKAWTIQKKSILDQINENAYIIPTLTKAVLSMNDLI